MQEKSVIDKAVDVLDVIWTSIDFESMSNSRKKEIWSEFKSKVRGSAISSNGLIDFVDKMCKKFNIQSIAKGYEKIVELCENGEEIVEVYRSQLMIVMFKLRMLRDKQKKEYAEKQKKQAEKMKEQTKMYADIPDDDFPF